jgi:hypothetical protein
MKTDFIINIPEDAPIPYSEYRKHNGDVCSCIFHYDTGQLMVLVLDLLEPVNEDDLVKYRPVLFPLGYLKERISNIELSMRAKS